MISNQHQIEIWVNDELIELESNSSLNLRINNVMFNPTQTTTTQASYSYSFTIPSTPNNDKIFGYANNLAKLNKFHARYNCIVYADGQEIFKGSLTIQKYSAKEKKYSCNLVAIKQNTLEDIFGEEKLSDLHWDVPFSGAPTINEINASESTKYCFPLICYGVFQKKYVTSDSVGSTYTSKKEIDKYNKWWIESFYPALNVVETMKKAFESKGYTVGGSALTDKYISNIYATCNLDNEQTPIYNVGSPKFGKLEFNVKWNNYQSCKTSTSSRRSIGSGREGSVTHSNSTGALCQDLKFPCEPIMPALNASNNTAQEEYNFDSIMVWNMMDSVNNPSGVTVTLSGDSYMYDPNEEVIVIPADGWYRIKIDCIANLSGNAFSNLSGTVKQWTTTFGENEEFKKRDVIISGNNASFSSYMPLEIQLVRNYDQNIELIRGKKNVKYYTGDPNQETYSYHGSYTSQTYTNKHEWECEFPHQDLYGAEPPTKVGELLSSVANSRTELMESLGWRKTTNGRNRSGGGNSYVGQNGATIYNNLGFRHKTGHVMPYDPIVSPSFICGFSSYGEGTVSVMKNGYSWTNQATRKNEIMSNVTGLQLIAKNRDGSETTYDTEYCKNTYTNAPTSYVTTVAGAYFNYMTGSLYCCVYLNKNDVLELMAIQRDYEGEQIYATSAECNVAIEAISQRTESELRGDLGWGWYSKTDFPEELNLFNFTNNQTKIQDWITNVQKALNLEFVFEGNDIQINTNKGIRKTVTYGVDIDDRVSSDEAESEFISYPKEMAVKWKINPEEYGFELTVPEEHINDTGDTWQRWGDSGFTVIELNDDSYETQKQETSTNFSYTYYMNFDFKQQHMDGTEDAAKVIRIPVIELSQYMAEGYGYDEAMQHDGYSLTQRFFYRGELTTDYVILSDSMHESVNLLYPMNSLDNFNLSYKDSEMSLATEYFNIHPLLASNYVVVEVYLNPEEYKLIKDGALVRFDNDLYYTSEISGFDPSGSNTTKLKLIKKI
jgi:hypothetical protein